MLAMDFSASAFSDSRTLRIIPAQLFSAHPFAAEVACFSAVSTYTRYPCLRAVANSATDAPPSQANTISFTLTAPSASFLARLALPFFCTVPLGTPAFEGGFALAPPSAGPYYMSDAFNGEYLILKRNPGYRGPARAQFDAIAFREGLAPEKAVARVKSGEWDGALLDDALIGPDSAVARQARRDSQLRYQVLSDRSIRGRAPPVYALLSSRLGCSASGGALDLAALCAREQDQ